MWTACSDKEHLRKSFAACRRESLAHLLHDSRCPLNACSDEFVTPWASSRTSEQIVRLPRLLRLRIDLLFLNVLREMQEKAIQRQSI